MAPSNTILESANDRPVTVGVVKDGEVANTKGPLPVSSVITPASSAELVLAKTDNLLFVSATVPVLSGRVIVRSSVGSVT